MLRSREGFYMQFGKRLLDIMLVLMIAPMLLPVIAALAVLARRDGGKAFFGHKRVGQNGASFRCWKIRSMVPDAEARLRAYLDANPAAAEEWARDHKLTNDPRITPFGDFIRKTSLDELPQIFNVLKGEMTFVGPRPIIEDELAKYGNKKQHYLAQKPGITGLWQVSGRNDLSYDERVNLDVAYLSQRSLLVDANIMMRTAWAVLGKTGR
nr:sugar transferase [Salipiger sp. PrR002]